VDEGLAITPTGIKLHIVDSTSPVIPESGIDESRSSNTSDHESTVLSVPWEPEKFIAVKGLILDPPEAAPALKAESRDAILRAIAKSRLWLWHHWALAFHRSCCQKP
jgi:hypothetical protein